MVALTALWMPILLSAVLVFMASSVIHMFLSYHKWDYEKVPDEDGLMDAMRPFDIPPGDYFLPNAEGDMAAMKTEAFKEKMEKGPVVVMTVMPKGEPFAMGPQLMQWFLYCVLVSVFAAYVASRAVLLEGDYLDVFRFAGVTAFAAYGLALPQRSIWYKYSWNATGRSMFDAFVYSLLTAGTFGWLWPS